MLLKFFSGRVNGVSRTMLSGKRELKQAPPLTADALYALEKHVCECNDVEACIGGFMIFCLLASARFADASSCGDRAFGHEWSHITAGDVKHEIQDRRIRLARKLGMLPFLCWPWAMGFTKRTLGHGHGFVPGSDKRWIISNF